MPDRYKLENEIATATLDACFRIHRELGPGLLESTYQACLVHELRDEGFQVEREVALPVRYRGLEIEAGYRIDMIVEDLILIENKSIQTLLPVHDAQLLTYLKLSGRRVG